MGEDKAWAQRALSPGSRTTPRGASASPAVNLGLRSVYFRELSNLSTFDVKIDLFA